MSLRHPSARWRIAAVLALATVAPKDATGQSDPGCGDGIRTVTVVPQAEYRAGGLHRLFFGSRYRDLWTDSIRVPLLTPSCVQGGLTAVREGGGQQTRSLRLEDSLGRRYAFRSLDKDPSRILPEELRGTIADRILQDQISAALPAGPLIAAHLAETVGILHLAPRLYQMADDPGLGPFRETFAGMVGFLERGPAEADSLADARPSPRDAQQLYRRLAEHADETLDLGAALTARLFDLYIGDWDRHQDQWRWVARTTSAGRRWFPIPRDRDQAFARYDGLLLTIARATQPKFLVFGPEYGGITGATWNGRDLDRRLLSNAAGPLWDSVATAMATRLTDQVIDEAVARMVPSNAHFESWLAAALRTRRDRLPAQARKFYAYLASEVDVYGTARADTVTLDWALNGTLDVSIRTRRGDTTFARRFLPEETNEVRLFTGAGSDLILLRAEGPARIRVRLVAGPGADVVVDESGALAGNAYLTAYDVEPNDSIVHAGRVRISGRPFLPPAGWDSTQAPPRDWGTWSVPAADIGYQPDLGLYLGTARTFYFYGFRQLPYRASLTVEAGLATTILKPKVEITARLPELRTGLRPTVRLLASGVEQIRYFGIGNETPLTESARFYRTPANDLRLDLGVEQLITARSRARAGIDVAYTDTDIDDTSRILGATLPYGSGGFGSVSARIDFETDTRDRRGSPTRGHQLRTGASITPSIWDARASFGQVHAEGSTYLTAASGGPTLAVRAGGRKVWGEYPFMHAAYLGGTRSMRGFREQRFAGDAAAWGGVEVRQDIASVPLVLPATVGLFGAADAGRVFVDGEQSDRWHHAVGGGLAISYLGGQNTLTLSIMRSRELTAFYIRGGYSF